MKNSHINLFISNRVLNLGQTGGQYRRLEIKIRSKFTHSGAEFMKIIVEYRHSNVARAVLLNFLAGHRPPVYGYTGILNR